MTNSPSRAAGAEPGAANTTRRAVLRTVRQATEPLGVARIAELLAVHPNTVRFHLDRLLADGLVEHAEPRHRAPGRPPRLFRAVDGMDPTGPRHYRLLAEVLLDELAAAPDADARATEAGRSWGRRAEPASGEPPAEPPAEPLARLLDMLGELGFGPEAPEDRSGPITLRHCPFLDLTEGGRPTVCAVHLGLMQGALESWRSPVTVERLDPFVGPDRCLAHLGPAEAGS